MELRDFNEADGYCYSGAVNIDENQPPKIAEWDSGGHHPAEAAVLIVSGEAIFVAWHYLIGFHEVGPDFPTPPEGDYKEVEFLLEFDGQFTPRKALDLVASWNRIPNPEELRFLGFKKCR